MQQRLLRFTGTGTTQCTQGYTARTSTPRAVRPSFFQSATLLAAVTLAACGGGGSSGPPPVGPPASITIVGSSPSAPANTDVTGAKVVVKDANGNPTPSQTVTFSVTAGGGSLQSTSATTGTDGTATIPTWRLGKRAEAQTLTATTGSVSSPINATVTTGYNIDIRYYGTQPTDAQKALFLNAANRIRGVVTKDLQNVFSGANFDISDCLGQTAGTTIVNNETYDDLVIYATVITTGGSNTIASAGPCYYRNGGTDSMQTVIGVMRFSPTFMNSLTEAQLQNVITHEMLHVVGVGSWWLGNNCASCNNPGWNLVADTNTLTPRFTGATAKSECQAMGGVVTCANGPRVENDTTKGTGLVHWEKDVFGCELMVGFICSGTMPFSRLTIGSLKDIRLDVNSADFDDYSVSPFMGSAMIMPSGVSNDWERPLTTPLYGIDPRTGRVTAVIRR